MIHRSDSLGYFAAAETAIVIITILLLGLGPLLTVMSINALTLGLVPVTLGTYAATGWLMYMVVWLIRSSKPALK